MSSNRCTSTTRHRLSSNIPVAKVIISDCLGLDRIAIRIQCRHIKGIELRAARLQVETEDQQLA